MRSIGPALCSCAGRLRFLWQPPWTTVEDFEEEGYIPLGTRSRRSRLGSNATAPVTRGRVHRRAGAEPDRVPRCPATPLTPGPASPPRPAAEVPLRPWFLLGRPPRLPGRSAAWWAPPCRAPRPPVLPPAPPRRRAPPPGIGCLLARIGDPGRIGWSSWSSASTWAPAVRGPACSIPPAVASGAPSARSCSIGRSPTTPSTARRTSGRPRAPPSAKRSPPRLAPPAAVVGIGFDATCSLVVRDRGRRAAVGLGHGRAALGHDRLARPSRRRRGRGVHRQRPPRARPCRRRDVARDGDPQADVAEAATARDLGARRPVPRSRRLPHLARQRQHRALRMHADLQVDLPRARGEAGGGTSSPPWASPTCSSAAGCPRASLADRQRSRPAHAGRRPAELGLTTGCRVATGLIDAHAGALGVLGAAAADGPAALDRQIAMIAGTSTCHMALSAEARPVPGVWGPYLGAVLPGLWLEEGGQSASGAARPYRRAARRRGRDSAAIRTPRSSPASPSCARRGPAFAPGCTSCPTSTATARRSPTRTRRA